MKPFEWMILSTPQTEWIEKRGVATPIAFYAGSLGAGWYLVSLYFDTLAGMIAGWFMVALVKSVFHVVDLYHPLRAMRMLMRPQTSWISRGLIITLVFLAASFFTIVLKALDAGTTSVLILEVISVLAAVMLNVYPGFLLRSSPGIKVWQSMWIPVIFLSCGILGGLGGMELFKAVNVGNASPIPLGYYYTLIILTAVFLSRVAGKLKIRLWTWIVLVCVLLPFLLLMIDAMGADLFLTLHLVNFLSALVLGVWVVFAILRAGGYEPML